jgi:chaperonin cofactor prefoldin
MAKTPTLPNHVRAHPAVKPTADRLRQLRDRLREVDARRDQITAELNLQVRDGVSQRPSAKLQTWLDTLSVRRASLQQDLENLPGPREPVLERIEALDSEHARVKAELDAALVREHAPGPREQQVTRYLKSGEVTTAADDEDLRKEYQELSTEASILLRAIPQLEQELSRLSAVVAPEYCNTRKADYRAAARSLFRGLLQVALANDALDQLRLDLDGAGVVSAGHLPSVVFHAAGSARYYQDPLALWVRQATEAGALDPSDPDVSKFLSSFKDS